MGQGRAGQSGEGEAGQGGQDRTGQGRVGYLGIVSEDSESSQQHRMLNFSILL